jgi:hypothetical protein
MMLNRTCRGRAIWQKQQQLEGGTSIVDGPVLYAQRSGEHHTGWILGPAARVVDCSDLNVLIYAQNSATACIDASDPRFGSTTLQNSPDIVACNPPVSTWFEILPSCEGVGDNNTDCHCNTDEYTGDPEICFFYSPTLRVDRIAVVKGVGDDQLQLCVPS